jgi:hypothetical protein
VTNPPTAPPATTNASANTSWWLGWASIVALVVPPGLVIAPVCGLLATGFGIAGLGGASRGLGGRDRALTGVALGIATLLATGVALYVFWHPLMRAVHDIRVG